MLQVVEAALTAGLPVALATSGLKDVVLEHISHAGLGHIFNDTKGNLGAPSQRHFSSAHHHPM